MLQLVEGLILQENFTLLNPQEISPNVHSLLCRVCKQEEEVSNDDSNRISIIEHAKEFLLRCTALRPYLNSCPTPQLMYALISNNEIRVSTALTERIPW